MRFRRSEGLTPSEQVLAQLCDCSFLKLWTYPNLYKKKNKELTDLLIVFGNDVIIFSDKSCAYPSTGDQNLDWSRWYRRSIQKSARQIDQAERWLLSYPNNVYLDASCTTPLPITLPEPNDMRVYRICVTFGATNPARLITGRPALAVVPSVLEHAELFTVGRVDAARGWIHVYDEMCLASVLGELSTVPDFVHYLAAKEALFNGGQFMRAEAETDIMAYCLWNGREFPPSDQQFRLEPDLWAQVEANPQFLAARAENQISSFWDTLIEYITQHYLEENLEFGNELTMSEYERMVRVMAGEKRFFRRILSRSIIERAERAREQAICSLLEGGQPDVNYVLYVGRGDRGGDHAEYRRDRALQLRARCIAAKAVKPERRYIIGLAMDARGVRGTSEDFLFLDTQDWSIEAIAEAEIARQRHGYFIPGCMIEARLVEDEYPAVQGDDLD